MFCVLQVINHRIVFFLMVFASDEVKLLMFLLVYRDYFALEACSSLVLSLMLTLCFTTTFRFIKWYFNIWSTAGFRLFFYSIAFLECGFF